MFGQGFTGLFFDDCCKLSDFRVPCLTAWRAQRPMNSGYVGCCVLSLKSYNFRIHRRRRINWLEDPGLIFLCSCMCACAHLHMCGYTCICVCRPEDGLRYLFLSVSTLFRETVSYWPARLDRQAGVARDPRLSLPSSRTAVCAAVIGFPTLKNSVFLGSSLEPPPCKASTLLIELCPQPGLSL